MVGRQISLPTGENGTKIPLSPATVPLKVTYDTTVSTTTQITFNTATTLIRVAAISQDICLRWGTSAASAATDGFDEIILAGQVFDFAIPIIGTTGLLQTAANFIERAASATLIVIEK